MHRAKASWSGATVLLGEDDPFAGDDPTFATPGPDEPWPPNAPVSATTAPAAATSTTTPSATQRFR
jgi:hypothetical protein